MESERKIEDFEVLSKTKSDEIPSSNQSNGGHNAHKAEKENADPNKDSTENNIRRHDEPSELSFEICECCLCCCDLIDDFINIFIRAFRVQFPKTKKRKPSDDLSNRHWKIPAPPSSSGGTSRERNTD